MTELPKELTMPKPDPPAKEKLATLPIYASTMDLLRRICSKEFEDRPMCRHLHRLVVAEAKRLGIDVTDQS